VTGRPLKREFLVVVGLVVLATVQTGITSDWATRFYAGPDPIQDVWILDWIGRHLLVDPGRVFEGNNFFPTHDAILFCDPLLGPALLSQPLRMATDDPVLIYNLVVVLGAALASYGFYRLALGLGVGFVPALFAGVVIPYSAPQLFHMSHLNLFTLAGFPLFIGGLLRMMERPGPGAAAMAALGYAFQASTSGYHAFTGAFLALIVAAWAWRRLLDRRVIGWSALAAVIAALALAPYLWKFAALKQAEQLTRGSEIAARLAFDPAVEGLRSHGYLWGQLLASPGTPAFPGLTVAIAALLGLWHPARRLVGLWLAVAAFFALIALGPTPRIAGFEIGPSPTWLLHEYLPAFDAVRHPDTFMTPALLGIGMLAALGLDRLTHRKWLPVVMLAAATLETFIPPVARIERPQQLPEVYAFLKQQPPGAILELPFDEQWEDQWRWWSIRHGMPIVNGMGSFGPRSQAALRQLIRKEWRVRHPEGLERTRAMAYLKGQFPIRYLIWHPGQSLTTRRNLDATPRSVRPLFDAPGGDRVYRVLPYGRGNFLKRRFRDDQLRGGMLRARIEGLSGATLRLSFNGESLASWRLGETALLIRERLPLSGMQRGLNLVRFDVDQGEIELLDLEVR